MVEPYGGMVDSFLGMPSLASRRGQAPIVLQLPFPHRPPSSEMRNFARQSSGLSYDQQSGDNANEPPASDHYLHENSPVSTDMGSCSCGSIYTPHMEDIFRRRLRFFFMNPCEKWRAKHRFPYKLVIQFFKIFIVTLQVSRY